MLAASLAACGGASQSSTPTTPSAPVTTLGLFIVGLPPISMVVGQTISLRAIVRHSNQTSTDVTAATSWASDATAIAPISPSGTLTALAPGVTTISASHAGFNASRAMQVADAWPTDQDFRVAILNVTSTPKPMSDVIRVFDLANDMLHRRTGARMRIVDMRDVGPGSPLGSAQEYLASLGGDLPDGVLAWAKDANAVDFGGYSTQIIRPEPYANRYPGANGSNRVYLAAVHWEHKYSRCGYDASGETRVGTVSSGGECRGQSGLVCVDNGRFWECPGVAGEPYAQPDVFTASSVVHEFMHPFGNAGNNDHYGTPACRARLGMSAAAAADQRLIQEYCGMCPDVFLHFRPR
jgi:hypothetical protein